MACAGASSNARNHPVYTVDTLVRLTMCGDRSYSMINPYRADASCRLHQRAVYRRLAQAFLCENAEVGEHTRVYERRKSCSLQSRYAHMPSMVK